MKQKKSKKIDDKLNYSITIISLALIILLGFIFWMTEDMGWFIGIKDQPYEKVSAPSVPDKPYVPSEEASFFNVSGGGDDYPMFIKQVMVDSLTVKMGDKQCFSVWVKDPSGIQKVLMEVTTDSERKSFDMKLVEGTEEEGEWLGCWKVEEVSPTHNYLTYFSVISSQDAKQKRIKIVWSTEALKE